MFSSSSIPDSWKHWLLHNRDRGCSLDDLSQQAVAQGLDPIAVNMLLSSSEVAFPSLTQWFEPPMTKTNHQPRAWKLDTSFAQIYELPALLNHDQCNELIEAINCSLRPSTVTRGDSDYRTSRTCHLRHNTLDLTRFLDLRLAELMGVDPRFSEPLQGQRYDPGEYFREHTDWFAPDTNEFEKHTKPGGQRTWTVMIYLNSVDRGGETCFKKIGRCFSPCPGHALAWNNLHMDGTPNPFTLHEALPVINGSKWIITKWFRASMGRNG